MAVQENIEQAIKELMVERLFLKGAPEQIGDEEALMEKYGLDSVNIFELVAGLEEVYGITFEDTDFQIDLFRNVRSISDYVRDKLRAQQ